MELLIFFIVVNNRTEAGSTEGLSKSQLKRQKQKAKDALKKEAAVSEPPEGKDDDGDGGDGDDGDEVEEGTADKKKKKKKKKGGAKDAGGIRWASCNLLGATKVCPGQSTPPTKTISSLFPDGNFPTGEICTYLVDGEKRLSSAEKRALERADEQLYKNMREAAEVHRQVRQDFQRWVRPGHSMLEIVQRIEAG